MRRTARGPRGTGLAALTIAVGLLAAAAVPPDPRRDGRGRSRAFDVAVDGRIVGAVEAGDPHAPPVLFLHGSPGSWRAFRDYLLDPALAGRFHLLAVDRPGFGRSRGWGAVRSLAEQAAAIRPVLDRNRSGIAAIVVGHSLGGPLAVRFAVDHSGSVAALVLVAPSVDPDLERVHGYQRLARSRWVSWAVPGVLARSNVEILALREELERLRPAWSGIRVPVVVIHGTRDRLVPVANVAFARRMLTGAPVEIETLEGAGHLIPWTRPEVVRAAILRIAGLPVPSSDRTMPPSQAAAGDGGPADADAVESRDPRRPGERGGDDRKRPGSRAPLAGRDLRDRRRGVSRRSDRPGDRGHPAGARRSRR